jgi:DNA-binding FadR family transcriptional regulator
MRQHSGDLEKIRHYLAKSGFENQDRLPPERDLAIQLGLTRSKVRYCLNKLAAEGLIWRHVGKGTYFGPKPSTSLIDLKLGLADMTNPREIIEARLALEPPLARLAAIRGTNKQFAEMDECLGKFELTADHKAWEKWDNRIHHVIAAAAGNQIMAALLDVIRSSASQSIFGELNKSLHTPAQMREGHQQHVAIVDAIKKRRPDEAEELMRKHLQAIHAKMFGSL